MLPQFWLHGCVLMHVVLDGMSAECVVEQPTGDPCDDDETAEINQRGLMTEHFPEADDGCGIGGWAGN